MHKPVMWPELVREWELTSNWARWIDEREGSFCLACSCSLRSRQLAEAILSTCARDYGIRASNLLELVESTRFRDLRVAEINTAGNLHQFLEKLPRLAYAEYGSENPHVPSENLLALSYADNEFDMLITSETLEHVPDVDRALREVARVLKPGGVHVFTVPIITARKQTKQRARVVGGEVIHDYPPSYHGSICDKRGDMLVFYEFGIDFFDRCKSAGYSVTTYQATNNPALVAIATGKKSR